MAKTKKNESITKTQEEIDKLYNPEWKLNNKQKHFCELYVYKYYHCAYLAYMEAYEAKENSAKTLCYRLLDNVSVKSYVHALEDDVKQNLKITFEDTVNIQQDAILSSMMGNKVDLNGITKCIESLRDALGMNKNTNGFDNVLALFSNVKDMREETNDDEPDITQ